jgi:hypothetical protein
MSDLIWLSQSKVRTEAPAGERQEVPGRGEEMDRRANGLHK